jgi:hypothetical protein
MASKKVYDLAVVVGHYTDNAGTEKNRYQNIGVVLQKDDGGKFILLDRSFNPAGVPYDESKGNTILVSMFDPKSDVQPKSDGQQDASRAVREAPRRQSPYATDGSVIKPEAGALDFVDDVPF